MPKLQIIVQILVTCMPNCHNKHISLDLPFAQGVFDKVFKPHEEIANFILSTCYLKIQRQS